MRRVCIEKCECLDNPLFGSDVSQRRSWLWQGRDGHVLPLTRATEGASVIALAVDARARAFKSLSRGMLPPLR